MSEEKEQKFFIGLDEFFKSEAPSIRAAIAERERAAMKKQIAEMRPLLTDGKSTAPELREALEAAQAWMIALQESAGGWWKHPNGSASLVPVLLQINAALAASKKEV